MRRSLVISLFLVSFSLPVMLGARAPQEVPKQSVERIVREVRHQILLLPYYNVFDNIAYRVQGYDVTLMGYVTDPALKNQAGNVVKHIEGVQNVDNRIKVLPPSSMDDQIRLAEFRAIYGYPSLQKYAMPVIKPIRIIVDMGHVILEGVVDSQADKNLIGVRANGVPNVFSVKNNLQVVNNKE